MAASLQADDEFLDSALSGRAECSEGDIQARLARMQETLLNLRSQSSPASLEEKQRFAQESSHYEQRLARHRAQAQENARKKLLGGPVRGEERKARQLSSQAEVDREESRALAQGLESLRGTQSFMTEVGSELSRSSSGIATIKDRYSTFGQALDSATKALGQLKTKTESDSTYIWWSFIFFMSVVTYIFLKRLKVFKVLYYSTSWTLRGSSAIGGYLQDAINGIISLIPQDAVDGVNSMLPQVQDAINGVTSLFE